MSSGYLSGGWDRHGKHGMHLLATLKRARHRDSGGFLPSPHPAATQLSLSLCVSGTSWATVPPPEPRVSATEWVSLCGGPFTYTPGFPAALCLNWMDRINPRWFLTAMDCGAFSFWLLDSGLWSLVWGCDPWLLGRDLCSWDTPPDSQLPHIGAGPALFMSRPLLPVSRWLLLYSLTYRASVQLVFRLFYNLVLIWSQEETRRVFSSSTILCGSLNLLN